MTVLVRGRAGAGLLGHREDPQGRTERRIMNTADARLTLITRAECHLCEVAKEAIARVAAETGQQWVEVDVDADPELQAEYWDRVPVILLDGKEHGYWRVEEERFRAALGEVSTR